MNRILTIAISALMLAGCASRAPLYDKSAVPNATAAMREATALCEKEQTAFKFTLCQVAAQRDFAVAIHLPRMDAFDIYAAKMLALAAERDAGRITLKQMGARATSIRNDYWLAYAPRARPTYDHGSVGTFFVGTSTTPVANSGPSS